jgi:hypothetical protein
MRVAPPFLLGAALAVASVVSAGLLLYGGPGFLRALAVLLATLLAALAAGVVAGAVQAGSNGTAGVVDSLRRRWLLTLVFFALAAVFSATWEGFRGFGALALTQGLGLAVLGALPMFAGGSVLGMLSRLPGPGPGYTAPAPVALAGAASGALALGFVLFPTFSPTGILLVCLVFLSAAALVQGRTLDEVTWAHEVAGGGGADGGVRLERWVRGRPHLAATAVVQGGRLRVLLGEGGEPVRQVDRAMLEGLPRWEGGDGRWLLLGAGGAAVAAWRAREGVLRGPRGVVLVEEDGALLETVAAALGAGPNGDGGPRALELKRLAIRDVLSGSPAHLPPEAFGLIVLDTLALAHGPADFRFPDGALLRLRAALRPEGVLIAGPLQDGGRAGSLLDRARHLATLFPRVSLYVAGRGPGDETGPVPPDRLAEWRATRPDPGTRSAFLVAGLAGPRGWPDRVAGYLRVMLEEAGPR